MHDNPLATRIREIREQLGISRKQFAGIVGVKVDQVCELERGERVLHAKRALAWARRLDIDDHALLVAVNETHIARANAATARPFRPLLHELEPRPSVRQRGGWR